MTSFVAFTDHHGSAGSARKIASLAQEKKVECLVCGGDFAVFEESREDSWRLIADAGIPVYFIAGNHESPKMCKRIEAFYPGCHWIGCKVVKVAGVQIAGIDGTDDLSPHHEEDLEAMDTYLHLIRSQLNLSLPLILVSHYPPAGTACCGHRTACTRSTDRCQDGIAGPGGGCGHEPIYENGQFQGHSGGRAQGSRIVRNIAEVLKPRIVICGHFHDRFGATDTIGDTLIINPGPQGTLLDAPAESDVQRS
ncbi:MAG: metallophosphoesterase family protein [Nitrospirae bacterium]|nr:metallophosphoesterase family protein [Nitrospirota bacterium]